MTWHSVVKIGQSLYIEAPGMDPFRPEQATPVPNFFLAGSYTKQDYIDSMEGATLSGACVCARVCVCMCVFVCMCSVRVYVFVQARVFGTAIHCLFCLR
jgi:hypothetical protein